MKKAEKLPRPYQKIVQKVFARGSAKERIKARDKAIKRLNELNELVTMALSKHLDKNVFEIVKGSRLFRGEPLKNWDANPYHIEGNAALGKNSLRHRLPHQSLERHRKNRFG